jgi:hypothetical protein
MLCICEANEDQMGDGLLGMPKRCLVSALIANQI